MTQSEKNTLRKEAKTLPMNHTKRVDSESFKYVSKSEFGFYAFNYAWTDKDAVKL